jgi:membrane protein
MDLISTQNKNQLLKFIANINKHEIFTLSAALAYTTALAIAPFVLILLSFASLLGADIQKKIYTQLVSSAGEKAGTTIIEIVKNARGNSNLSGLSGIIGMIVLAISASTIFIQLRLSLNKINEFQEKKTSSELWVFLKERFLSIGFVFGFVFLSIVSLLVSIVIAIVFKNGEGLIWQISSLLIDFIIFSILFTVIYRFIPSEKMDWIGCRISGMISGVFYLIGKNLISLYIGKIGIESSYGAAGSLIAFLVWVYFTTLTLFVSYEFTKNIFLSSEKTT